MKPMPPKICTASCVTSSATFAAPLFPKYVLLMPADSIVGFFAVLAICVLASIVAIRMALKVDPAEAIGG